MSRDTRLGKRLEALRSDRAVGPRDAHARARRLLSERMEVPLSADQSAALASHLVGCARCRSVDRAYQDGRRALRMLRPSVPPRDLGARVAAALDAEIRKGHRPATMARPSASGSGFLVMATTASMGIGLLVVGGRLLETPPAMRLPNVTVAAAPFATPFDVPTAELALVDVGTDGLTVYQASVSLVCPPSAVDCATAAYQTRPVLGMPGGLVPRGIALDHGSRRMALLAEDAFGADSVSVVVLPPMDLPGADDPLGVGPGPDGRWPTRPRVGSSPSGPSAPPALQPGAQSPPPDRHEPAVLAILDGVQAVGAPPAWSVDGEMLAFSAMPADRSQGPDIYVWRPGEVRASRVTNDHASWFASWSGTHLVLSRVEGGGPRRSASTVLLDPVTQREKVVPLAGAWLPAVDPSGRFAVAWRGSLAGNGPVVRAREGGLMLLDWASVDPAAVGQAAAMRGRGGSRARTGVAPATVTRTARGPADTDAWLEPLEPPPATGTVALGLDWQVRWASQGTTFGYWVADASGASWGRLTVLRVLAHLGRIDRETELLAPTLARRSFTLGVDRVAWVAPADEGADGELRVRTWGLSGQGGLRIGTIRLRHGIPAF